MRLDGLPEPHSAERKSRQRRYSVSERRGSPRRFRWRNFFAFRSPESSAPAADRARTMAQAEPRCQRCLATRMSKTTARRSIVIRRRLATAGSRIAERVAEHFGRVFGRRMVWLPAPAAPALPSCPLATRKAARSTRTCPSRSRRQWPSACGLSGGRCGRRRRRRR